MRATRTRALLLASLSACTTAPTLAAGWERAAGTPPRVWTGVPANQWETTILAGPFGTPDATSIEAPALQSFRQGALIERRFCNAEPGTRLVRVYGKVTAYHRQRTGAFWLQFGSHHDAAGNLAGGQAWTDSAGSGGILTDYDFNPIGNCAYWRVVAGGPVTNTPPRRLWGTVITAQIEDLQGPGIGGLAVDCAGANGWCRTDPTLRWTATDNNIGAGTSGLRIQGQQIDLGGPGGKGRPLVVAEGTTPAELYATGVDWPEATARLDIRLDKTTPSAPTSTNATLGAGSAVLSATGSTDQTSGVGGYEFSDGGRPVPGGVIRDLGTHTVRARAVDRAGNTSDWGAPVTVVVTREGPPAAPRLNPVFATNPALPDLARARLTSIRGTARNRIYKRQVVSVVRTRFRSLATIRGRFGMAQAKNPLRGATVWLLTHPTAPGPVGVAQTDRRGHFTLRFRPSRSGLYQLCAVGQPMICRGVLVRVAPRITLSRPTTRLAAGERLRVAGRVSPGPWAFRRVVRLEFRSDAQWVSAGRAAQVERNGRFSLSYRMRVPLRTRYRVRMDVGPREQLVSGASRPFVLRVR